MKLILGFVGQIASGKGSACDYIIKKYDAGYFRFSSILRDITQRLHLPEDREHLQKLSTVLRQNFGQDLLAKVIAEDVSHDDHQIICVDGIRRPDEIVYLKDLPGFVLVSVEADMKTRFERLTKRNENQDDQQKTFDQFQLDHENENEKHIVAVAENADIQLDNNGSIEDLYHQLDKIVEQYRK